MPLQATDARGGSIEWKNQKLNLKLLNVVSVFVFLGGRRCCELQNSSGSRSAARQVVAPRDPAAALSNSSRCLLGSGCSDETICTRSLQQMEGL